MEDGHPFSDRDHFHMWIQTRTHVIDFQAPVFREALGEQVRSWEVPRLMFQRGLNEQCDGNFQRAGDFDLFPNPELTDALVDSFLEHNGSRDLLFSCEDWFIRPPKPIPPTLGLGSSDGAFRMLSLSPIRVDSAWGR